MMKVYLESVGVVAPGMLSWLSSRSVLRGESMLNMESIPPLKPKVLPAAMLRRTTKHIRMAIAVASQTLENANTEGLVFASVFAASENDAEITDEICREVVSEDPFIAASSFNNSVSNAAVGTWSIVQKSQQPTTCVTGYDMTFTVGLLEAASQVVTENRNVMLVAHDVISGEPLYSLRPLLYEFGVGFLLTHQQTSNSLAQLNINISHDAISETIMQDEKLESIRSDNPAARSLPILNLLANEEDGSVVIPYHDNSFVEVDLKWLF